MPAALSRPVLAPAGLPLLHRATHTLQPRGKRRAVHQRPPGPVQRFATVRTVRPEPTAGLLQLEKRRQSGCEISPEIQADPQSRPSLRSHAQRDKFRVGIGVFCCILSRFLPLFPSFSHWEVYRTWHILHAGSLHHQWRLYCVFMASLVPWGRRGCMFVSLCANWMGILQVAAV